MPPLPPLADLTRDLRAGQTTSLELIDTCLERITDSSGEGSLAFLHVDRERARQAASASDQLRAAGVDLSPLMGIPFSVKDLFDIAGQPTRAGSTVLLDAPPAEQDAEVIARLRRAGAIILGRTNMTEFAYSGVGLNPHYGTPASPYDRSTRRIPGGSSSGAGVSVSDGMAAFAMGTDTGGSVRIPAALCGISGFKSTRQRISTAGVFPLSSSFDSVGHMAPTLSCCITIDQIISGQPVCQLEPMPLTNLRFVIPEFAVSELDDETASIFTRIVDALIAAGAHVEEKFIEVLEDSSRPVNGARLLAAEAYAQHRALLDAAEAEYDPRVSTRMMNAANLSSSEYIDLLTWRTHFVSATRAALEYYDALLMPTTPEIPPPIEDLERSDEVYFEKNKLMLRNTSLINQIDGCAISIPYRHAGEPPVGLMIAGLPFTDEKICRIGLAVETWLTG